MSVHWRRRLWAQRELAELYACLTEEMVRWVLLDWVDRKRTRSSLKKRLAGHGYGIAADLTGTAVREAIWRRRGGANLPQVGSSTERRRRCRGIQLAKVEVLAAWKGKQKNIHHTCTRSARDWLEIGWEQDENTRGRSSKSEAGGSLGNFPRSHLSCVHFPTHVGHFLMEALAGLRLNSP